MFLKGGEQVAFYRGEIEARESVCLTKQREELCVFEELCGDFEVERRVLWFLMGLGIVSCYC